MSRYFGILAVVPPRVNASRQYLKHVELRTPPRTLSTSSRPPACWSRGMAAAEAARVLAGRLGCSASNPVAMSDRLRNRAAVSVPGEGTLFTVRSRGAWPSRSARSCPRVGPHLLLGRRAGSEELLDRAFSDAEGRRHLVVIGERARAASPGVSIKVASTSMTTQPSRIFTATTSQAVPAINA
jgi:hypothetical protein